MPLFKTPVALLVNVDFEMVAVAPLSTPRPAPTLPRPVDYLIVIAPANTANPLTAFEAAVELVMFIVPPFREKPLSPPEETLREIDVCPPATETPSN
jgi:hypothetical protein